MKVIVIAEWDRESEGGTGLGWDESESILNCRIHAFFKRGRTNFTLLCVTVKPT
jgi:hypothetical protein